jgi:hypothetical protein
MGVARRIKEMAELNGGKHVNDAKKGIDVLIKYDPKAKSAGDTYRLERGERTPLTAEELEYLRYDLEPFEEIYDALGRTDSAAAMADLKKSTLIGGGSRDDDDDEDDDDEGFGGKGKGKGKGKIKKSDVAYKIQQSKAAGAKFVREYLVMQLVASRGFKTGLQMNTAIKEISRILELGNDDIARLKQALK